MTMALERPSAVRFYAPDHPMLAATVRAALEKYRGQLIEELMLAKDWGDYCERRGVVKGVDAAIQHTLNAEQAMKERN